MNTKEEAKKLLEKIISEKSQAALQLLREHESMVKELSLTKEKLAQLTSLASSLSEKNEHLQHENNALKEKEVSFLALEKELSLHKEKNRALEEKQLLSSAEKKPPLADHRQLQLALREATLSLELREKELIEARSQSTRERKRFEEERNDLMRKLAETANQLQRELEVIRELKESILQHQNEIACLISEKEASIEEIQKFKTKEQGLLIDKRERNEPPENETLTRVRSYLEQALSLLSVKGDKP